MGKIPADGGPPELAPKGCKRLRVRKTDCDDAAGTMEEGTTEECEKIVVCCDWECSHARDAAKKAFSDWVDGVFVVEEIDDGWKKIFCDGTVGE